MVEEKRLFGPIWAKLYHYGFFKWRYAPVSILVTKTKLIVKYLGIIKVRDISLLDIKEVKMLNKNWVNKLVLNQGIYYAMTFMHNPLMISYNYKSKLKTDFIVAPEESKKDLLKSLVR